MLREQSHHEHAEPEGEERGAEARRDEREGEESDHAKDEENECEPCSGSFFGTAPVDGVDPAIAAAGAACGVGGMEEAALGAGAGGGAGEVGAAGEAAE